jgi:hypothetical protein
MGLGGVFGWVVGFAKWYLGGFGWGVRLGWLGWVCGGLGPGVRVGGRLGGWVFFWGGVGG